MLETTTLSWFVYDNNKDEPIGSWIAYEDAEHFLLENAGVEDNWQLFPSFEL